jgi:hypothetical protein
MKKSRMKCRTCGARICEHARQVIDEYVALAIEKTKREAGSEMFEVGPDDPRRQLSHKIALLIDEEHVTADTAYVSLLFCVRLLEQKYGFKDKADVIVAPGGAPQ